MSEEIHKDMSSAKDAAKKLIEQREENGGLNYDDKEKSNEPANTLGNISNLSKEEEKPIEEKITSLGKRHDQGNIASSEAAAFEAKLGWHELNSRDFPSKGIFYPIGTRFFVKAAKGKEIRHYSTMNEHDPYSVDESLNDIISTCLDIRIPDQIASWKDLKEEDRIYIVLSIKEHSFKQGENKISYKIDCNECDEENEIEIRSDIFTRTDIPDTLMKYYSPEENLFVVKTKTCGEIRLAPPSIGIMQEITKYQKEKLRNKKKLSQDFMTMVLYMVLNWRGLNTKKINDLEVEYIGWPDKKFEVMYNLIDMCKVSVDENITIKCKNTKCGAEVTAPVQFPGGLKNLFVISDISSELL